jgi:phenylpyruvate tautomerase PptA (4-oxalocrotonate tautomerase family)
MPVITIKVFEGELTWGQTAELVDHVTEAAGSNVSLLVEVVRSGSRGTGGKALGLKDLRHIQQSAPANQQPYACRAANKNTEAERIGVLTLVNRKVRAMSQWRKEEQNGGRRP